MPDTDAAPIERLHRLLRNHPDGLSEHALILALENDPLIRQEAPSDILTLFQTHLLLFHHLYRLEEQLRGKEWLEIHCLKIVLGPWESGNTALPDTGDPLRDYYLNLDNLATTGREEVAALLAAFWERFVGQNELAEALRTLDLEAAADYPTAKRRYRELAMRHHPDRGGDTDTLQAINAAMAVLARHYGRM